jgi:hypothetical protein
MARVPNSYVEFLEKQEKLGLTIYHNSPEDLKKMWETILLHKSRKRKKVKRNRRYRHILKTRY